MHQAVTKIMNQIQQNMTVRAIRRALVTLIPVLLVGCFALLLESFPIPDYITFITSWKDGVLYNFFHAVQNATFGMLSVYTVVVAGYQAGAMITDNRKEEKYGTMLVSLATFFILAGPTNQDTDVFGAKGMFIAIVSIFIASEIYLYFTENQKRKQIFTDGVDLNLQNALYNIFPLAVTVCIVAVVNYIILCLTGAASVYDLTISTIVNAFGRIHFPVIRGLVYVIGSSILWFFGIHGSDVMEGASSQFLGASLAQNMQMVAEGQQATEILTKPFIDCFVILGGAGSTVCLLIALLFFSKRKGTRRLMKVSIVPMLFNINEIMLFGLPVIYNLIFFIPFILVPVVMFLISYFTMYMGWVPVVSNDIKWTTPIIINAYLATGSFKGIVLQVVNILVGVAIYAPFVKMYDKHKSDSARADYELLVEAVQESEAGQKPIRVTDNTKPYGWVGMALAADLEYAFGKGELKLFYQPQFDEHDRCIGAEALLRWLHPQLGYIYPPLILKIAEEIHVRDRLEQWVINQAIADAKKIQILCPGRDVKISANVTGKAIQEKDFEKFLEEVAEENNLKALHICLEITEQDALVLDDVLRERFFHLQQLGYSLAVDDFSMGSTSIKYLIGNHFELLKLDGSLVKGILDNPRCYEIIATIVHLSDNLGVKVLAEYVSNEEIRDKLLEVGCHLFQGWYFSPAVDLEEFEKMLK